jgi:hypothetical protein
MTRLLSQNYSVSSMEQGYWPWLHWVKPNDSVWKEPYQSTTDRLLQKSQQTGLQIVGRRSLSIACYITRTYLLRAASLPIRRVAPPSHVIGSPVLLVFQHLLLRMSLLFPTVSSNLRILLHILHFHLVPYVFYFCVPFNFLLFFISLICFFTFHSYILPWNLSHILLLLLLLIIITDI